MTNNLRILLAILTGLGLFSSCAPKYTASFTPSRTFYTVNDQTTKTIPESHETIEKDKMDNNEQVPLQPSARKTDNNGLIASTNESSEGLLKKQEVVTAEEIITKYEGYRKNKVQDKLSELSVKEKRALIKEVKKDIKGLKKAEKKDSIENRKVYAGIIIALAGLLVAILVSGTLGGLGILVGIVLIAWGLIEEGTI